MTVADGTETPACWTHRPVNTLDPALSHVSEWMHTAAPKARTPVGGGRVYAHESGRWEEPRRPSTVQNEGLRSSTSSDLP